MKIKLYKLLEMIDKGEELPKKIKIQDSLGEFFEFKNFKTTESIFLYFCDEVQKELLIFLRENFSLEEIANLEIEIEGTKTLDTFKLDTFKYDENKLITSTGNHYTLRVIDKIIIAKINEIIKYINKEE